MRKDTMLGNVLETKSLTRRRETREDIMLMLQRMMNHPERDPDMKVKILQARMNMFLFPLTGNITHGSNDWLIDNGASKHMTGFKESFT